MKFLLVLSNRKPLAEGCGSLGSLFRAPDYKMTTSLSHLAKELDHFFTFDIVDDAAAAVTMKNLVNRFEAKQAQFADAQKAARIGSTYEEICISTVPTGHIFTHHIRRKGPQEMDPILESCIADVVRVEKIESIV